MREMRSFLVLAIMLAVLVAPALAAESFSFNLVTVQEAILPGESALFDLQITNNLDVTDKYTLASNEYGYILFIDERPEVSPGETGTYSIEISPRSFINTGTHRIPLTVRSTQAQETDTVYPIIFIRDPNRDELQYTPSIALSLDAPEQINPRDDLTLNIALRNRNARNYDKDDPITVVVQSDIFERSYQTNLGPVGLQGEKTNEIRIDIDPYQVPGVHPLNVYVKVANKTVSEISSQFTVNSYSTVEETVFEEKGFFTKTTTYRLRNDGNVEDTATIVYTINPLKRLFVSSSENFEFEDVNGQLSVFIVKDLASLEEHTITVTENYRLLVLLIILIFASLIGYIVLRSPVVLGKEAVLGGSPEDGVSELKIRVLVKNRSSKTMRHLRVIDRISGMADIVKEESLGTLKPTKVVRKEGQGTLLRWDIDQLEPFEERIISYKARTPLKLVGDVMLPAVKVKFDVPSGRERTSHSNEVTISRSE